MRKISILVFSCCLSISTLNAQSSDYIRKDSSQIFGKITIVKGVVQIKRAANEPAVSYGPNEINEFSSGGHLYRPLEYNGEKLFFRKIISDSISLYRTKGKFVIEKNGLATEVNRKNFREVLLQHSSCEGLSSIPRVTYGRVRLKTAVRMLNTNPCKLRYFPSSQFGITIGVGSVRMETGSFRFPEAVQSKFIFPLGLYAELPVYRWPGSSFAFEVAYVNTGYTEYLNKGAVKSAYFDLKAEGVIVPIGLKLALNRFYLKPFIKTQTVFSYVNLSSRTDIVYSIEQNGTVSFSRQKFIAKSDAAIGFALASGIQLPVYDRHCIQVEAKYLSLSGAEANDVDVNLSGIVLSVSYNF